MGNLAEYEKLDLEDIDEIDEIVKDGKRSEFWTPPEGDTQIRFLPGINGNKALRITHRHQIEKDNDDFVRFVCPRSMTKGQERCPACELADELKKRGNPADQKRADAIYPGINIFSNIIVRGEEAKGPRLFVFKTQIWGFVKKILKSQDGGDVTDPGANGFDCILTREGTKKQTKYSVRAARNNSPLSASAKQAREWIENQWPLDKHLAIPDSKQIMREMGIGGGEMRTAGAIGSGRTRTAEPDVIDVSPKTKRRNVQDDVMDDEDGEPPI